MKYQIRIHDIMGDKPASRLLDTKEEAENELIKVQNEIKNTWATPDIHAAYIFINYLAR